MRLPGCRGLADESGHIIIRSVLHPNKSNEEHIIIPTGVTRIGEQAFWGCSNVTDIMIPEGVTGIDDFAFCMCSERNMSYSQIV